MARSFTLAIGRATRYPIDAHRTISGVEQLSITSLKNQLMSSDDCDVHQLAKSRGSTTMPQLGSKSPNASITLCCASLCARWFTRSVSFALCSHVHVLAEHNDIVSVCRDTQSLAVLSAPKQSGCFHHTWADIKVVSYHKRAMDVCSSQIPLLMSCLVDSIDDS